MVNPLFALLGGATPTPEEQDIIVNAASKKPAQVQESDAPVRAIGNRDARDEAEQWMKGVRKKGGGLRDIIGTLGDALLMGSGGQAIYRPVRDKELLSSAFAGMSADDPNALDMTLERLAQVRPDLVPQFYNYIADNKARAATTAATGAKNQADLYREGTRILGQYAGALARNPRLAPQLIPAMQKAKMIYGLGNEFVIPDAASLAGDNPDVSLLEAYQYGGTPVQTQVSEAGRESRFTRGEEGKDRRVKMQQAGANQRDNPPPPVKRTRTEAEAEIIDAVTSGRATPSQQKYYEEVIKRPPSKSNRFKDKPAPAGKGKMVFRNGKLVQQ